MAPRADIMQGTLDLMVLRTLETMGPLHGWGIAQRLEQVSEDALRVNQGTLYPALLRLEQRGLIRSKWGTSENNRRARFYSLTASGRRQLPPSATQWHRLSGNHQPPARVGGMTCAPPGHGSRRLVARSRGRGRDAELDEELRFHLDMQTAAGIRRGMPDSTPRARPGCASAARRPSRKRYRDQRGLPVARHVPAGRAVRRPRPAPRHRLRADCRRDAHARHRRHDDDLQPGAGGAAGSAAVSRVRIG